jgi:hypothetical protein
VTSTKLLLGALAFAASAGAVRAQSCRTQTGDEIIASCDAAFEGSGIFITSARGWCYLINAARCSLP